MRPNRITRTCVVCRADFLIYPAWVRKGAGKYCSKPCRLSDRPARDAFFTSFVDRSGDCWLWTRPADADGYGHAWDPVAKRSMAAHRLALTLALGADIQPEMQACHTCDNRLCVRNDEPGIYVVNGVSRPRFGHLWLGSTADNTADKMQKRRHVVQLGADHHHARFTESDIRTMHHWYGRGLATSREIARLFGTRREYVNKVMRGNLWGHLGLTPFRRHQRLQNE